MKRKVRCLLYLLFLAANAAGQSDSADHALVHKRLPPLVVGTGLALGGTLYILGDQWYSSFDRESFHFFNDAGEWKQVDKAGHFYGAFQLNSLNYQLLQWSGLDRDRSRLWSGISAFVVMSTIEIMDGYSSGYGASTTDLLANSLGIAAYQAQLAVWQEIRIHPKYGFRRTGYAELRPDILGSDLAGKLLKDYNGQTYWLSVDLSAFTGKDFPKWLNVAVGYGAEDMIYARDEANRESGYDPYRQWYLAPDIDLSHIHSRSKFVNSVLFFVDMIRIPAPALEFSRKGVKVVIY